MTATQNFKLLNGSCIPAVGLGSWQGALGTEDEISLEQSIVLALQNGYRLIDTAQYYGVEHVVGRAIKRSGIDRSEITVVTKFWGSYHHDVAAALNISKRSLSVDYIDLFLMHWPWASTPDGKPLRIDQSPTFVETWKQMEKLVGPQCRGIGVCNFTEKTLDVLLEHACIVPAINQFEVHALNPCFKLVSYCKSKGIHVMSWGTLGGDSKVAKALLLGNEVFTKIAVKHGVGAGTISLSWTVQRGITVIPKSSSEKRIKENFSLVTLDAEDMGNINGAHKKLGQYRISEVHDLMWIDLDGRRTLQGWTEYDLGWEDRAGRWLT